MTDILINLFGLFVMFVIFVFICCFHFLFPVIFGSQYNFSVFNTNLYLFTCIYLIIYLLYTFDLRCSDSITYKKFMAQNIVIYEGSELNKFEFDSVSLI